MKDKNRFSILLEHLMTIAELKNSILAKAVQYDDSYISKWISGKLLPTEKNHENTLQAISHCIVEALSEESTTQLLQEYQLQDIKDLETAIYDNLESEYMYVKELQNSTGTEVAPKISYYPERQLAFHNFTNFTICKITPFKIPKADIMPHFHSAFTSLCHNTCFSLFLFAHLTRFFTQR